MAEDELTTIQIPMSTRDRIKKFWTHADDTYHSVLEKILDVYEQHEKRK